MPLDFDRVWLPYLYLYGVGGVFFLGGLWMVVRSEGFNKLRASDRRWLALMFFGFIWYAGLHGIGILAATSLS
ncbi:MAG: hypothetical protein MK209_06265 [Planctomycetes bacterium]|nr:hypothetical protein [Planctomycetota bacterium]